MEFAQCYALLISNILLRVYLFQIVVPKMKLAPEMSLGYSEHEYLELD